MFGCIGSNHGINFNKMKELNRFRKFLNENKMATDFPEFYGEMDDSKNDIANSFVTHIESDLDGGATTGVLNSIDYLTSDEDDPDFQETDSWFYDLVRYMMDKGNEVTVTAQVEGDKVWSPPMKLTLDPKSQDITWETLEL